MSFRKVFDTKKHTNVKRKASYRRINKYYKGIEKTKAEKERHKKILKLLDQGLTIRQTAQQLKVSERTVKRDLAKMRINLRKKRKQLKYSNREFINQIEKTSLKKQFEAINENLACYGKDRKPINCNNLQIIINLDDVFAGKYGTTFKPKLPVYMFENGRITLELETGGKKQAIARIYVGEITYGSVNLQTSQSMNATVEPLLKGLTITDPKTIDTTLKNRQSKSLN